MPIEMNEVFSAFKGSLGLNFKVLRELYQAESIELCPQADSMLYLSNDLQEPLRLFLPLDSIIGTLTVINRCWDPFKQNFIEHATQGYNGTLTLLDIGANVGLFARQTLNRFPRISKVYCYEPNPQNFKLMARNLAGIGKVALCNYGLSDKEGMLDFHLDPDNSGNYSLTTAMMPANYKTMQVRIEHANKEKDRWLRENDGMFIYKSDTQGYDEVIATSFDFDFWSRVKCGTLELTRLAGKEAFDVDKFVKIIESFPIRVLESKPTQPVTAAEVLKHLEGTDGNYDDLLFWR